MNVPVVPRMCMCHIVFFWFALNVDVIKTIIVVSLNVTFYFLTSLLQLVLVQRPMQFMTGLQGGHVVLMKRRNSTTDE